MVANVYTALANAVVYTDKLEIATSTTAVTYQVYATALGSQPAVGNLYSAPVQLPASSINQVYVGVGNRVTVTGANWTATELGTRTSAQAGVIANTGTGH
jgi:hypothetical protein